MSLASAFSGRHWPNPRLLRGALIAVYCVVIFLGMDLIYSNFLDDEDVLARVSDPRYHHGLVANFTGHQSWGWSHPAFYTNSLGFRDGAVRAVALIPTTRRVLLIGDSFTEGQGVPFEESFAGLLYQAGQQRTEKIEFLNAGVSSYSPIIYYKKIKTLIEEGLQFDEVVVFSDVSDVFDESARDYFCIDNDPHYFAYCNPKHLNPLKQGVSRCRGIAACGTRPQKLQSNFVITEKLFLRLKYEIDQLRGKWLFPSKSDILYGFPVGAWTIPRLERTSWAGMPNVRVSSFFAPLGIEGGVARSRQNMQKLADLLAKRGIPLTVAVYPWAMQLANDDRESRQVTIWRDFCAKNCKEFINIFPAFFEEKGAHEDWYERLFIYGDIHFSAEGNKVMFREFAKRLL
jgi:lysophospholipase L1-like esterase